MGRNAPDSDEFEAAVEHDRELLRVRLRSLLERPEIADAFVVASPSLMGASDAWRADPTSHRGRRFEAAVVRYFSRMTNRATPFGLFAGFSVGRLAATNDLRLPARTSYRRTSRLDSGWIAGFLAAINAQEAVRSQVTYRPNSSLYEVADRLHYIESQVVAGARRHSLVAVDRSPELQLLLARASAGAGRDELATDLRTAVSVEHDEAVAFVDEVIDSQLLVPHTELGVTCGDPAADVIGQLGDVPAATPYVHTLRAITDRLGEIDAAGIGVEPAAYDDVRTALAQLPGDQSSHFVQVDLFKPASNMRIAREYADEVLRVVDVLRRLNGTPNAALRELRNRLVERYERRAVPLATVLDDEIGIGLPAAASIADRNADRSEWVGYLGDRLVGATASGSELVLTEAELQPYLNPDAPPLPDAFAALVTLSHEAGTDPERLGIGLAGISGPSGASLFGRFVLADPELDECVRRHLRAEEALHPDVIYAEVVHLPQGRLGNILMRPSLRDYEIPYLCRPGVPSECQIPVTDLTVSVDGDRIVLYSDRLGRRVVPRITSAHNHSAALNLPLYRFLGLLQHQGAASGTRWDWGPFRYCRWLPRVRIGGCVVAPASWQLRQHDLEPIVPSQGVAAGFAAVQRLRKQLGMPRHVAVQEPEQGAFLVVDLENVLELVNFIAIITRRERTTVTEAWPSIDVHAVRGPEGSFANEVIIPYVRVDDSERASHDAETQIRSRPGAATDQRSFALGSEWLYVKIYCGAATADRLLLDVVGPLAERLIHAGAADCWFFVRYADPSPHLRVRFQGDAARLARDVEPEMRALLQREQLAGRTWRVQYDTYEREIERYGGVAGVCLAERLFCVDSTAVVQILRLLREPPDASILTRERAALIGIDALLSDFGLTSHDKAAILESIVPLATPARRQVGKRYRHERAALEDLLGAGAGDDGVAKAKRILRERSSAIRAIAASMSSLTQGRTLQVPLHELLLSYAHMHVNRVLRPSDVDGQERVLYEMLSRYHRSMVARDERRTPA